MLSPANSIFHSCYGRIIYHTNLSNRMLMTMNGRFHIHNQTSITCLRVSIPMQACTQSSGQFHIDRIILQQYLIISRPGTLLFMRETRTIAFIRVFCCPGNQRFLTDYRHKEYIAIISNTRSTKMGMGKAHDGSIVVIIAGTGIPAKETGIRTQLHHSMR